MADGEDWIMRPVLNHMCQYESLKNGAIDLADIDRMNEALDVKEANRRLAQEKK